MKESEISKESAKNAGPLQDSSDSDHYHDKDEESHRPNDIQAGIASPEHAGNVFEQGGKSYRTMSKWDTLFVMVTNQFGLGILSLPSVLKTLGIVPGIIAIVGIGFISWYAAYVLFQFYKLHPHVINVVEMTRVVGGRYFEMFAGLLMMIQVIFVAASAVVTLSIAFNTISDHATCTVIWILIPCVVCYLLNIPRTMKFVSHSGVPNAISVLAAAFITIIALGVAGPRSAPDDWHRDIVVVGNPDFRDGLNACLKVVYAYAANIAFVGYMAEMIDPARDFGFCLASLQIGGTVMYLIVAIIIYCLGAQYSTSPALGAAPTTPAKVAYGVVLPAVFSTGVAYGHTGGKFIYVLAMKKMGVINEVTGNSAKAWISWIVSNTIFWIIVFVLSNAIPVFDSILSIASATTISWFNFGFSAIFWFHANWDTKFDGWKQRFLALCNFLLIALSLFMNGGGLWSSITELLDLYDSNDSSIRGAFSCGSNAQF